MMFHYPGNWIIVDYAYKIATRIISDCFNKTLISGDEKYAIFWGRKVPCLAPRMVFWEPLGTKPCLLPKLDQIWFDGDFLSYNKI